MAGGNKREENESQRTDREKGRQKRKRIHGDILERKRRREESERDDDEATDASGVRDRRRR